MLYFLKLTRVRSNLKVKHHGQRRFSFLLHQENYNPLEHYLISFNMKPVC